MKTAEQISTAAVVGAGTMGHGIAHALALAGIATTLVDLDAAALEKGLAAVKKNLDAGVEKQKVTAQARDAALAKLSGSGDLEGAARAADVVIEAVPEKLELKQRIFTTLDAVCAAETLLATNTSSLPITKIAAVCKLPARVVGMHFFNPVHLMALLELISHTGTDPAVLDAVAAFGAAIGKECIRVRDLPGFATSRLGVALGMEAIRMVQDGVASPEDIDKAMVLGYRHPVGPLKLTDMVGLDVRLHIGEYLARELANPAFEPPALMREMVAAGTLGQKSGQGFYRW
jgi:3-hydroxybutyryl-CoA dehydrogenase